MKNALQADVTFLQGFANERGEISSGIYVSSMQIQGAQTIARVSENHLEPAIPKGTLCTFDETDKEIPDGTLVIATVTLHTPALRTGKRKLAEIGEALPITARAIPQIQDEDFTVIRWLRRDASTGAVSLQAAHGEPLLPSRTVSIAILGVATPDLGRAARSAAAREAYAQTLGYRRAVPEASQGEVHLALEQLLLEEQGAPNMIPRLARSILVDPQLRTLHLFRQAESAYLYETPPPLYPIDMVCARFFRAGQLAHSLQQSQPTTASFTLLDAEEIRVQAPLGDLIDGLQSSAIYFELLRQYDSQEAVIVWDQAGSKLTMPVLATRMFRAGQISMEVQTYAKAA